MQIYGQLEKAQIENLAADPTGTGLVEGRVWYRTDLDVFRGYANGTVVEFADLTTAQTFLNKTLTSPTINTPTIDQPTINNEQILQELAVTPATPAAGYKKLYPKTDGLLYTLNSNGDEVPVGSGSGGSGFKNYLAEENSTFDLINTDWAVYNEGNAVPVAEPTGGVPSGNLTRALTDVVGEFIAGERSLKLSKGAASALGEGISVLTKNIDEIDRGKRLPFEISKKFLDSNYQTGDLKVYAWDVTNGEFLRVTSDYGQDILAVRGTQQFRVQTKSTTESIRIALHVASTNANAYDVVFDQIGLVVKDVIFNTANVYKIGEEVWTTDQANATARVNLYRIGSRLRAVAQIDYTGAGTGSVVTLNVPSQYAINTDFYTVSPGIAGTRPRLGDGLIYDHTGSTYNCRAYLRSASEIRMATWNTSGATPTLANVTSTVPITFANNDAITLEAEWEVQGWEDDTTIRGLLQESSLNFDSATVASNFSNSTAATDLVMPFDSIVEGSNVDDSTGIFTAPRTAKYQFNAQTVISGAQDQEEYRLKLRDADTLDILHQVVSAASRNGTHSVDLNKAIKLQAGQRVELIYRQSTGSSRTYVGGTDNTFIDISEKGHSQASIVEQNKVAVLFDAQPSGTEGGSSLAATWTTRILNSIEDPFNIVDLVGNQFTLQPGKYHFTSRSPFFTTTNIGGGVKTRLRDITNGVNVAIGTQDSIRNSGADNQHSVWSRIETIIEITEPTTFALQYYMDQAVASFGLGLGLSLGVDNIYSQAIITKIGA